MAIQGLRTSGNFEANQRPKNWREAMLLLFPNGKMPITGLTSQMKDRSVNDPEFNWFEKVAPTQRLELSANLDASQTSIAVVSGANQLKKGHILRTEAKDEVMMVTADPTSDTAITVSRGYAGSTAATVTIASEMKYVHVVGTAHEEGSLAPTGINYDPTKRYNYTQIFRSTLEMTRTASKTRLRTGDAVKEAKRECLMLHGMEMEKAFIFGYKSESTQNGKPIRTTDGILRFIDSSNIVNHGVDVDTSGLLEMEELEGYMERMFRYGSQEKMAILGNEALLGINQCIRKNSHFQITSGIKEYGMNVSRLTCPFGELVLKTHPLFNQLPSQAATVHSVSSWMLVLDMDEIGYVSLEGDDTKYQPDLQENGLDGMKAGYLSECGMEVHHPLTHFLIKGIRGGVVDS